MKLRALALLLFIAVAACTSGPADFGTLALDAYPESGKMGDRAALDRLWTALFKLPKWYFVRTQISGEEPAVELVDGKSSLVAFTEPAALARYGRVRVSPPPAQPAAAAPAGALDTSPFAAPGAPPAAAADVDAGPAKPNPYVGSDGKPLYVEMTPAQACDYLSKYRGPAVELVRFNVGTRRSWGGPPSDVIDIHEMLKKDKKVP
ncbi:MAG: hypothetical protein IPJ65_25385 [Archangiaceae bacterium]|nr:hypothetical protein [Archangiaceae bacterium]